MRTINDLKNLISGIDNKATYQGTINGGAHFKEMMDSLVKFLGETAQKISDEKVALYKAGKQTIENSDALILLVKTDLEDTHLHAKKIFEDKVAIHFEKTPVLKKSLNFEHDAHEHLEKIYIKLAGDFAEYQTKCKIESATLKTAKEANDISSRANKIAWLALSVAIIAALIAFFKS